MASVRRTMAARPPHLSPGRRPALAAIPYHDRDNPSPGPFAPASRSGFARRHTPGRLLHGGAADVAITPALTGSHHLRPAWPRPGNRRPTLTHPHQGRPIMLVL